MFLQFLHILGQSVQCFFSGVTNFVKDKIKNVPAWKIKFITLFKEI